MDLNTMIRIIFLLFQLSLYTNGHSQLDMHKYQQQSIANIDQRQLTAIAYCPTLTCVQLKDQDAYMCSWNLGSPKICYQYYYTSVYPPLPPLPPLPPPRPPLLSSHPLPVTQNPRKVILKDTRRRFKQPLNCGMKPATITVSAGSATNFMDWPWMASLFTKSVDGFDHFCGGSIISENAILTAAHCVHSFTPTNISELFVGVGSNYLNSTVKIAVHKMIVHPDFVPGKSYDDIALLITSTPIAFNESTATICLPGPSLAMMMHKNGKNSPDNVTQYSDKLSDSVDVIGWGKQSIDGMSSDKLLEAKLQLISNQQCNQSYNDTQSPALSEGIKASQLCAGSEKGDNDSCQGDSGGPLTIESLQSLRIVHHQIGIVSSGRGCGNPKYPGVYTRVAYYVPWIEKQLTMD